MRLFVRRGVPPRARRRRARARRRAAETVRGARREGGRREGGRREGGRRDRASGSAGTARSGDERLRLGSRESSARDFLKKRHSEYAIGTLAPRAPSSAETTETTETPRPVSAVGGSRPRHRAPPARSALARGAARRRWRLIPTRGNSAARGGVLRRLGRAPRRNLRRDADGEAARRRRRRRRISEPPMALVHPSSHWTRAVTPPRTSPCSAATRARWRCSWTTPRATSRWTRARRAGGR